MVEQRSPKPLVRVRFLGDANFSGESTTLRISNRIDVY